MLDLTVEEINNSSIIPNTTVKLFWKNSTSRPAAVSFALDLALNNSVFGIIGEGLSTRTIPMSLAMSYFRVFTCSGAATTPELSIKSEHPYFFRTIASDVLQARVMGKFIKHMNWTRVALISQISTYHPSFDLTKRNDEYGINLSKEFVGFANSNNISILTTQQSTFPEPPTNATIADVIQHVKSSGARIIVVFTSRANYEPIFKAARFPSVLNRQQDLVGTDYVCFHLFVTVEAYFAKLMLTLYSQRTEGMVFPLREFANKTTVQERTMANGAFSIYPLEDGKTSIYNQTKNLYRNRFGFDPYPLNYFWRDCLMSMIYGIKNLIDSGNYTLAQVLNRTTSDVDTTKFVKNLSFEGVSGPVYFDKNGDRPARYVVYNYYNGTVVESRMYDSVQDRFEVLMEPMFYDGTSAIPVDAPPMIEQFVSPSDGGVLAILILHSCMIFVVIASIGFLTFHRSHEAVKSMSIIFLWLIAFGLVLVFVSVFAFLSTPTPTSCLLQDWLSWLGYVLVISNVSVKVYRIFRIFDNSAGNILHLPDMALISASSGITLIDIIILAVYSVVSPPIPDVTENFSTGIRHTICKSNSGNTGNIVLIVYNLFLLMIVLYLAFATRNVVSKFRESRYIGYAAQTTFMSGVICLPVTEYMSANVVGTFYVRSTLTFFAATVTYGCLLGRLVFNVIRGNSTVVDGKHSLQSFSTGGTGGKTAKSSVSSSNAEVKIIRIPVKRTNKFLSQWRNHDIAFYPNINSFGMRDARSGNSSPFLMYDIKTLEVAVSKGTNVLELYTDNDDYLLQFETPEAFSTWIKYLQVQMGDV
ncbi:periplasmic binding protein-like I [Paraphysoderma sedebokerense]|nr:periplasmic binding protein-like I [Paraphysoderma sedebokerense]